MSLNTQIKEDIKNAMRAKDAFTRDTLRQLSAAMKQVEVDERIELSDERIITIIQQQVKRRNDSIEQYRQGGREDLVEAETKEKDLLMSYLPKQLTDEELETKVKEMIATSGATSGKDMGKVMGLAKTEIGSLADNKRVSMMAKKLLG